MNTEIFTACKSAKIFNDNTMSIDKGFDTIRFKGFPATLTQVVFAVRLNTSDLEYGKHDLQINFINEDGKQVSKPLFGSISAVPVLQGDNKSLRSKCFTIIGQNVVFDAPGEYQVDLGVDTQGGMDVVGSIPLYVDHE